MPTLFTVPSSDRAFATYVRKLADRVNAATPAALERRLRGIYPRVTVRARELDHDDGTWYVYREGGWVDGRAPAWWADEGLPRIELSGDGWILAANDAAGVELGVPARHLLYRHFTDFTLPGTLEDAILAQEVLAEVGEGGGTIRHLDAHGVVQLSEYHARATEAGTLIVLRPVGAEGAAVPPAGMPVVLDCRPPGDRTFERVVASLVAGMPQPSPAGLQLRVRRTYPHASVEATGPDRWRATRDPRPPDPDPWWEEPGLPSVTALDSGLVVEVNDAFRAMLGRDVEGLHWQEVAPARSLEERRAMREVLQAEGSVVSTFRLLRADGDWVDYDYRTTWHGDRFTTVMRPFVPTGAPAVGLDATLREP